MASRQGYKNRNGFNTISYMTQEQEKPHWKRFKEEIAKWKHGQATIDFQDGLPVKIVCIEGKDRDIDLTKGGE